MADEPRDQSTGTYRPATDESGGSGGRFTHTQAPSADTAESADRLNQLAAGVVAGTEPLFGRYRIGPKLGAGGMGTVYLAWDELLCRDVAIKVCRFADPTAVRRFLQEARAAASLRHPHICQVYDFQRVEDLHCLVMPHFDGEVLRARTRPDRLLPPAEVARIVRTVALAMQAAHDAGVIHRDLKPSNVILDTRGEPIVVDFGLARRAADSGLTVGPMGTPAYMAPEQCGGEFASVGPAADVYSLGVVLFELLTGTLPFTGTTGELFAHSRSTPAPPPSARRPDLDPRFDPVVGTALAKEPARRWADMRAFADALVDLAAPTPAAGPELILSVVGSAFAYRPPPGWTEVRVGRQRRKPGAAGEGNDLVIRVAGNDALSARISRHHLEVRRRPTGLVVIDRSTAGLTRNGAAVPKGRETPLADGDVLGLAGVVELRATVATPTDGVCQVNAAAIPLAAAAGARIEIEASLGDVVTIDT